jgi:hypothetical protein
MNDSVALLRARWTPELTAAAIGFLQGNPGEIEIPTMELSGEMLLDLRGIRIQGTQLDGMVLRRVEPAVGDDPRCRLQGCEADRLQPQPGELSGMLLPARRVPELRHRQCEVRVLRLSERAARRRAVLDYARFRNCEIGLASIAFREDGNAQVLARVCHNLKQNAMSMGHLGDVSELSYMEKS